MDDLGWRDLGCFGSSFNDTPHIDRLAKEGMRFTDAYAACPVCSPTRASIQTGKHPVRMGTTDWFGAPQPETAHLHPTGTKPLLPAPYNDRLPLEEITIAEALKAGGYATFFAGQWHLGGEGHYPETQGFDINIGGYEKGSPVSYFTAHGHPELSEVSRRIFAGAVCSEHRSLLGGRSTGPQSVSAFSAALYHSEFERAPCGSWPGFEPVQLD